MAAAAATRPCPPPLLFFSLNRAKLTFPRPSTSFTCKPSPPPLLLPVFCGPRDSNRGPLLRGRTLTTEAILAVQLLKRWTARSAADCGDSRTKTLVDDAVVNKTLSRLAKPDLIAALNELQRQDHWLLALKVFEVVRGEFWYKPDYSLYAEMVKTLARNGRMGEIESIVSVLVGEQFVEDLRGLTKLIRALIGARMGKCAFAVYGAMRSAAFVPDDHLFGVLVKGLRRLGEEDSAALVAKDYETIENEQFEKANRK
ncbi:Pentatricopeptide repeat-containing protein [Nymphaea thermarum]|nr:Pentatricopeptide repeat-containing protein [Nymphaea thermarum]